MQKILFYTDAPNYGGTERQMELLARYLKPLGFSVSLACGAYSKLAERFKVHPEPFEAIHIIPSMHKHDPRHYYHLTKLLKKGHFKLLHLHLWNPGSCRYSFFAGAHCDVPMVATDHDYFKLTGIKGLIRQKCVSKLGRLIAISLDNFRQIIQDGEVEENRICLIKNGIDVDKFMDMKDSTAVMSKKDNKMIVCVAEFHARKGHAILFQSFDLLRQKMPTLNLVLVGTGPDEQKWRQKYAKDPKIQFLGWREDVPRIIGSADVLVLPSERESFGLVLLEAMASKVCVIATRTSGPMDIIEQGVSGLLTPIGDAQALANVLEQVLTDDALRMRLAENGLVRAREQFTAKRMAKETAVLYESLLGFR